MRAVTRILFSLRCNPFGFGGVSRAKPSASYFPSQNGLKPLPVVAAQPGPRRSRIEREDTASEQLWQVTDLPFSGIHEGRSQSSRASGGAGLRCAGEVFKRSQQPAAELVRARKWQVADLPTTASQRFAVLWGQVCGCLRPASYFCHGLLARISRQTFWAMMWRTHSACRVATPGDARAPNAVSPPDEVSRTVSTRHA